MAIWAGGTTINTTEMAMVVNKVYNKKAINIAKRKNGLLYAIYGKDESGSIPLDQADKFVRMGQVNGHNFEVRLVGALPSPAGVTDGANELATVNLSSNYDSAAFGGSEFAIAHYTWTEPLPHHQLYRYVGDEAKTAGYLQEVFDRVMSGYENVIGNAINGSSAPARDQIGGWAYAVATDNTYGGIDRTDSANASFRGNVRAASGGTLTLPLVRSAQNDCIIGGGNPEIGLGDQTVYELLQQKIEPYSQITYDKSGWTRFGGVFFEYAGTKWILDQRAPSNTLGILDPSTFVFIYKNMGLTNAAAIMPDPSRAAAHVMPTEIWCQLVCVKPNSNAKITGVTS